MWLNFWPQCGSVYGQYSNCNRSCRLTKSWCVRRGERRRSKDWFTFHSMKPRVNPKDTYKRANLVSLLAFKTGTRTREKERWRDWGRILGEGIIRYRSPQRKEMIKQKEQRKRQGNSRENEVRDDQGSSVDPILPPGKAHPINTRTSAKNHMDQWNIRGETNERISKAKVDFRCNRYSHHQNESKRDRLSNDTELIILSWVGIVPIFDHLYTLIDNHQCLYFRRKKILFWNSASKKRS